MGAGTPDIAIYGHAASALAHLGFLVYLLWWVPRRGATSGGGRVLYAALAATLLWSLAAAATEVWTGPWLGVMSVCADLARYALWFTFLLQLQPDGEQPGTRLRWLRLGAALAVVAGAAGWLLDGVDGPLWGANRLALVPALAMAVMGLLAVEQLWRNVSEDGRWAAKPLCLGLACVFGFDLYLYSEAVLLGRLDPDALSLRGAVHALSLPFLWVATRRRADWVQGLQVSRTAAFYSATLVLAGGYLLFMSAVGYYVRYFGGTWGRALQLGLLAAGIAFLAAMLFSGSLRAWIKVFVGKHFYRYRYDYREEWLRFTAMLSSHGTPQETGLQIVSGLARMVECPAGSLWTRAQPDAPYTESACWNAARTGGSEPADSAFCTLLRDKGWVVDLEEFRSSPRQMGGLVMPTWLLASTSPWLVVPLLAADELQGFVVLAKPRTTMELNWEVLDLLKTAGRQAAVYLAQIQAAEALLEARKFDAFNRMSAFVVHDLKNIVTQLSLMLKNAERLHDNREFQQDMLLTVQSSLEKMKRLMLQLREGAAPVGGGAGVELLPLVAKLQSLASGQGRQLVVRETARLSTRGHADRLERVLGHLVQNALDATPPAGEVWISLQRQGSQVRVEIGDTGIGMSEDFIKTRLFKPFSTTKHSGMGIGTYESQQYVRELGGGISVHSVPGQGTRVTVDLPAFEAGGGADPLRVGAS